MASLTITKLAPLVLLVTLSLLSNAEAVSMKIQNDCGSPLRVKCHWKHDDIGNRVVAPGSSWEWVFVPPPSETSVWYCGASFEHGSGVYDVYSSVRDVGRCNSCLWSVRPDGLHGISEPASNPEVFFKWQSTY
ncbi:PREDICTED: uncharacterized protein LOC104827415 [Tarenaya hassleriana]|uniref:uncharacterized protein LOC104827415 n=1 Tax=Tarenaya hassleriana TaxID=28532 RepID=UPI00053C0CF9|nr:PREDICTED: uncharacterized protein LOC104827415 [Tarenaya hassleriana]